MKRALAAFALSLMLTPLAFARDDSTPVIEKWYAALAAVDRAAFESLISDSAVIELQDIGIKQTKPEFIESLDEWEDAAKGARILHKIETQSDGAVSVRVCYTFSGNESLNREDFKIENRMVTGSVQAKIADSCEAFPK
jgi:hypothetical protein